MKSRLPSSVLRILFLAAALRLVPLAVQPAAAAEPKVEPLRALGARRLLPRLQEAEGHAREGHRRAGARRSRRSPTTPTRRRSI